MRFLSLLLTACLVTLAAARADAPETTYDRIMRTGVIRCGYMNWPPAIGKNPNTGEMEGIMPDYLRALGDALGLKIEWTEEVNLGTYLQDLNTHRYDMECSGGWPNALRGKIVTYSTPIYFFPIYAFARADDRRFDNNYAAINAPGVKIVSSDGETAALIQARRFPASGKVTMPASTPKSDEFMNVTTGKADLTFADYAAFLAFDASNPGKLRRVDGPPLRVIPNNTSFAGGEFRLQQMLDTATQELLHDGVIDRILDKYETVPGTYLRVAPPYVLPKENN